MSAPLPLGAPACWPWIASMENGGGGEPKCVLRPVRTRYCRDGSFSFQASCVVLSGGVMRCFPLRPSVWPAMAAGVSCGLSSLRCLVGLGRPWPTYAVPLLCGCVRQPEMSGVACWRLWCWEVLRCHCPMTCASRFEWPVSLMLWRLLDFTFLFCWAVLWRYPGAGGRRIDWVLPLEHCCCFYALPALSRRLCGRW